jgi:hypothetical protein
MGYQHPRDIPAGEVKPGQFIVHGGKRWEVWEVRPDAHMLRLRMRRFTGEKTSALWHTGDMVRLDVLQADAQAPAVRTVCTACGGDGWLPSKPTPATCHYCGGTGKISG